jgi:PAS domain S-box-containing protein
MRQHHQIRDLVQGTADPAFSVDGSGTIVAWNAAAEAFFGVPADQAIGRPCGDVVRGSDECGPVCSPNCAILQAVRRRQPVHTCDMQVQTAQGTQWCNVSVLIVNNDSPYPSSVHVIRGADAVKRLELLVRGFLVSEASLSPEQARDVLSSKRTASREVALTPREVEVLRLLATGGTTARIAARLGVSRATVNNHVQHIFSKLDAHTRLEAVRRAERAGLL